jgi:hypothetical protein
MPPPAAADAVAGTTRHRVRGRTLGRQWHAAPHGARLGLPLLRHLLPKTRQDLMQEYLPEAHTV